MADCSEYIEEVSVDCHLPEGHEGDHEGTVTWEQRPPPPPFDWEANPGYSAFLTDLFGGVTMRNSSPQTAELNRLRRWWRW